MKTINKKLGDIREKLGYSKEYVAKCLNIKCSEVSGIEQGDREITANNLEGFCSLYHVSKEYLLKSEQLSDKCQISKEFDKLTDKDKQEMLNLIIFKRELSACQC